MWNNTIENVFYYQIDGSTKEKEKIITEQGVEIQLYECKENAKKVTYLATFNYNENYYYIASGMPYEQIKKILKYVMIL